MALTNDYHLSSTKELAPLNDSDEFQAELPAVAKRIAANRICRRNSHDFETVFATDTLQILDNSP